MTEQMKAWFHKPVPTFFSLFLWKIIKIKAVGEITRTITMVQRLVSEEREQRINTINPPPCTVSIVLARRFGVRASKS